MIATEGTSCKTNLKLVSRFGVRTLECNCRLSSDSLTAGSSLAGLNTNARWQCLARMNASFTNKVSVGFGFLILARFDMDDGDP